MTNPAVKAGPWWYRFASLCVIRHSSFPQSFRRGLQRWRAQFIHRHTATRQLYGGIEYGWLSQSQECRASIEGTFGSGRAALIDSTMDALRPPPYLGAWRGRSEWRNRPWVATDGRLLLRAEAGGDDALVSCGHNAAPGRARGAALCERGERGQDARGVAGTG